MHSIKRVAASSGAAVGATLLAATPAFAQVMSTTTGAYGTTSTSTPGVPSTGAGGDFTTTIAILALAAFVVVAGLAYLGMRSSDTARGEGK